jgi:hypothetical protein
MAQNGFLPNVTDDELAAANARMENERIAAAVRARVAPVPGVTDDELAAANAAMAADEILG